MNHLTEEQLIEHYYGESPQPSRIDDHLRECSKCAESYATLQNDLATIEPITPPARDPQYGEQVWQSIRRFAPVYEKKQQSLWSRFINRRALTFATACAVLVAAAFLAGRQWEGHQHPPQIQTAANNQPPQPIILVVLGDHLDRSERLLVALKHADSAEAALPVKAEAQDLLSANRLYRQSAAKSGDPVLAAALDRLERVLVEIANEPDNPSPARLAELQKEMNTDGLLFEVRVLRSRVQGDEKEQQTGTVRPKGTI